MKDDFPLTDIWPDLEECDAILRDLANRIEDLLSDTDRHYPPAGDVFCQALMQIRVVLAAVVPPALQEAINAEQDALDKQADRWELSS